MFGRRHLNRARAGKAVGGADQQRVLKTLLVQHRVENRLENRLAVRAGHERDDHRCRGGSRVRSAATSVLHVPPRAERSRPQGAPDQGRLHSRAAWQGREADADPRRLRSRQQASGGHLQGMAGDPGEPQEPAGNRQCADDSSRRARYRGIRMNIDHFTPATVYTIYIASTPENVWQALTTAEVSRNYFFGNAVEVDLKIGGAYVVRTPDGSRHIDGEVIECAPPRKLTVTFNVNWPALIEKLGPTLVTYEIEPAGDVVRLTMTEAHDRPLSDDILSGGRQGWPAILSSLKRLLETG